MESSSNRRKHKRTFQQYDMGRMNKYLSCHEVQSVEELLEIYPGLRFYPYDPRSTDLWKDIVKSATPKNYKKKLQYDPDVLNELMSEELVKTVKLQNVLVRALKELGSNCTKVELLKLVTKMSNSSSPFCLGGGSRPDTKRLILMYEVEADVTAKKRKSYKRNSASCEPSSGSSSSSNGEATAIRAHSLAYGDGIEENSRIVTGMSLRHLFDDFDFSEFDDAMHKLRCSNSESEEEKVVLSRKHSVSTNEPYQDTQELFEDLIEDFQPDSWTQSH